MCSAHAPAGGERTTRASRKRTYPSRSRGAISDHAVRGATQRRRSLCRVDPTRSGDRSSPLSPSNVPAPKQRSPRGWPATRDPRARDSPTSTGVARRTTMTAATPDSLLFKEGRRDRRGTLRGEASRTVRSRVSGGKRVILGKMGGCVHLTDCIPLHPQANDHSSNTIVVPSRRRTPSAGDGTTREPETRAIHHR